MGTSRTFIVRVSDGPRRVVIEDVRERRRAVAVDLASVGAQLETWLTPPPRTPREADPPAREDSVSPAP